MIEHVGFQGREMTCVDCEQGFTWSARDQESFREVGFANDPKHCLPCRRAKRQRFADAYVKRGARK
jgi:hypothetical protein